MYSCVVRHVAHISGWVEIVDLTEQRALRSDAPTPDDFEVDHPGDYATFNSYQPSDGTSGHSVLASTLLPRCTVHGSRPKN